MRDLGWTPSAAYHSPLPLAPLPVLNNIYGILFSGRAIPVRMIFRFHPMFVDPQIQINIAINNVEIFAGLLYNFVITHQGLTEAIAYPDMDKIYIH
jgi:hypothetical protein